jgi:hypothetical protein
MSQSGTFTLVAEDERYDKYFTASEFLRRRIRAIVAQRSCEKKRNVQPTFADIEKTHILYLRSYYRPYVALATEYIKVKSAGGAAKLDGSSSNKLDFTPSVFGHFLSDAVFHVRLSAVGTQSPTGSSPYYRYCAYPGIRMMQRVEFTSDSLGIDDYTSDEVSFVNKFGVPADLRPAWDRGMGQAEVREGQYDNPNGHTGVYKYRDGLQTPKQYHPATDLWIPAQFFMGRDVSSALLNDLVPNSQRKITVSFEALSKILYSYRVSDGGSRDTYTQQTLDLTSLDLTVDLYINNIFVNPEIHDVFSSRVGFSLVRIHRRQSKTLTKSEDSIKMDQIKYPVESLCAGFRSQTQASDPDQWHLYGTPPTFTNETQIMTPAAFWNSAGAVVQISARNIKPVSTLDPIVSTVSLKAHGIDLFPKAMPASFFSAYTPQRYPGKTYVTASTDRSAMFIPFCVYPGQYNPSGYYNLSTARELYFDYTAAASAISSSAPAELYIAATTLNFIVRNGDSITLRYSL